MRIAYINPNATTRMTGGIVAEAQAALPGPRILGFTNHDGPAAIQGRADGEAAVPGLLALIPEARAQGAEAIVIACFDDTGLAEAQAMAGCPVLGIGQASYVMAQLLGLRFSVITSLAVSVPVIEENIRQQGFSGNCASVRASGLPVLTIDAGAPETLDRIAAEIMAARDEDGARCAVLGCAGMAPLKGALSARTGMSLIDGVTASAHLARAALSHAAPRA
ncbi:aspartate/glutamate racemase family protein [Ponticoccus alexandrii]|uniref:HyuE hydantoin racemase n=1 Tax=Ponticoccus alexandrii TaxID=1943633 RepID=A0ABX7F685_9RHOB|nr:aspartate/glutamate racemase family protein [Ponticoccus alexandrii]ETA52712.1 HyuE hydantoin racemase [Rhodobacteraceae bacterium PD-2]QRF65624.1 HyuE hydantoin racemase [Ponticoccus alexandrii]